MNLTQFAFELSDALSIILVIRLFTLRLHTVYRVFCAFLIFQVFSDSFTLIERFTSLNRFFDYRMTWLTMRIVSWTLSIWMVYALLQAIFARLPGILRMSRKILNIVLPAAVALAAVTIVPEYLSASSPPIDRVGFAVGLALLVERAIATIALLTLLLMLAFILWFPVRMPRNLALFSVGFILYFTVESGLLLFRSFWSHGNFEGLSLGLFLIMDICLVYWISFLNKKGEVAPMTLGHSWQAVKQAQLLTDLEGINLALARVGRR